MNTLREILGKYAGKRVSVIIDGDSVAIKELNETDGKSAAADNTNQANPAVWLPEAKGEKIYYYPDEYSPETVGNKAFRLGRIKRGGFVSRHITLGSGLYDTVLDLVENKELKKDILELQARLEDGSSGDIRATISRLQDAIKSLRIGDDILSDIKAYLKENFGIEGDAHASGEWHRQVSLLGIESVEKMRAMGLNVHPGDFAENITTEGIDLMSLPIGTKIIIGNGTELEVSQINLNDGTVEGLRHRKLSIVSIQYHAEGAPGPQDNVYLFDKFLEMVKESKK